MYLFSIEESTLSKLEGISYVKDILYFELSKEGFPVLFCQSGEDTFLKVEKADCFATITYGRKASAFRGLLLLVSHMEEATFVIEENCCFKEYGVMVDMSRNAVMKLNAVKRLICRLALMGYESMQVYTEDTLKVAQEEYMGYGRGAYYIEEIQEMDSFAQKFGIELIPCVECLGHLNQLTNYTRYGLMMDTGDILMVGAERTYEFIDHIFQTVAKSYTSRKVNVGLDEAYMLGRGRYMDTHGVRPRTEILAEHIVKIREIANKYGFTISMWSDMFYNLMFKKDRTPQEDAILHSLPEDVCLIYWDYGTTDYEACSKRMEGHLQMTSNVAFAGGTWKWWGLVPNNQHAMFTQSVAIKACKEKGIKNYLLTCWGDNGAEASIFSVMPTFFDVSKQSFIRQSKDSQMDSKECYDKEFYTLTGVTWEDFMKVECINRLNMDPSVVPFNNANKYFFYNDPIKGLFDSLAKSEYKEIYANHAKTMSEVKPCTGEYAYVFESIEKLAEVLSIKVCLGNEIRSAYETKNIDTLLDIAKEQIPQLIEKIDAFTEAFETQWMTDNKSFGFDVQCIRIGGVKQRLLFVQKQLLKFGNGEIDKIEELEEKSLPFGLYLGHSDANLLYFNDWKLIATPNCV